MRYEFKILVQTADDEFAKLCSSDMPCLDFLKEAITTALKTYPVNIIYLNGAEKPNEVVDESMTCPDCGAKMIARNGQYGKFWGCSKYPECRGTRDSEGRSKAERAANRTPSEKRADNDREWRWRE